MIVLKYNYRVIQRLTHTGNTAYTPTPYHLHLKQKEQLIERMSRLGNAVMPHPSLPSLPAAPAPAPKPTLPPPSSTAAPAEAIPSSTAAPTVAVSSTPIATTSSTAITTTTSVTDTPVSIASRCDDDSKLVLTQATLTDTEQVQRTERIIFSDEDLTSSSMHKCLYQCHLVIGYTLASI